MRLISLLSISLLCPSESSSSVPTSSPSLLSWYYVASSPSELCSTNQMTPLLTSAACSTAAGSLSLTFAGELSLSNAPRGCFFALSGFLGHTSNKVFYNSNADISTVSSYSNTYVVCFVGSVNPTRQPTCIPSVSPTIPLTMSPSLSPTVPPSFSPTAPPSLSAISSSTLFGFGVKIGDEGILSSGKVILVEYLRDTKRGIFLSHILLPHSPFSVSGKMFPISRIVNSSQVSSAFDPFLSSNSILIKWRPVSAVSGIGSWEPSSHTILSIPAGGVLVSWLVSLLSEQIKGFIVKGECYSFLLSSPSPLTFRSPLLLLSHLLHGVLLLPSVHLHLSQQHRLSSVTPRVSSWSVRPAPLFPQLRTGRMSEVSALRVVNVIYSCLGGYASLHEQ
jgi:hypothetical protein